MLSTYNTIEPVYIQETLPVWQTTWPGGDGCSSRLLRYLIPITFPQPPTGEVKWYEPEYAVVSKSGNHAKGYRPGYPPLRYTDYSVSKITYKRHLVRRHNGTNGYNVYYQYGSVPRVNGTCTPTISYVESTGGLTSYWDNVTHDYVATSYTVNSMNESDVSAAIQAVSNQVSVDALTSYDALTDIAQIRDIPRIVSTIANDLRTILGVMRGRFGRRAMRDAASISPIELLRHPDKVLRALGDHWLAYRYGIMPLVYSWRDIQKNIDRHINVHTRRSQTVNPRNNSVTLPGPTSTYKRVDVDGSVTIRGSVFQSFSSAEVARVSGLGFNPLVTAWELIPYSFVVDWFVNVGDYITRRTSQSLAGVRWACLSRRDAYTKRTSVHLPQNNITVTFGNKTPDQWWGSPPPATPSKVLLNPEGNFPLYEEIVDSYSRWTFNIGDAQLSFRPSLSWRRLVDAAALALNFLGGFNGRLRKGL